MKIEMKTEKIVKTEVTVKAFGKHWVFSSDEVVLKEPMSAAENRELLPPSELQIKNLINQRITQIDKGWAHEEGNLLFYSPTKGYSGYVSFQFAVERTPKLDKMYEDLRDDKIKIKDIMNYLWDNQEKLIFN